MEENLPFNPISFYFLQISDSKVESLTNKIFASAPNPVHLTFWSCSFSETAFSSIFNRILNSQRIQRLILRSISQNLTLNQIRVLCDILKSDELQEFHFIDNFLPTNGISVIAETIASNGIPAVKLLSLTNLNNSEAISETEWVIFAESLNDCFVEDFNFSENSPLPLQFLDALRSRARNWWSIRLKRLTLRDNSLNLNSLELLRDIFVHLEYIDLSGNSLNLESVQLLSTALSQTETIKEVELNNCEIDDEGLKILIDQLETSKILSFGLCTNELTDKGIIYLFRKLVQVDKFIFLESLYLDENLSLSDTCFEEIYDNLLNMSQVKRTSSKLKLISLEFTNISDINKEKLENFLEIHVINRILVLFCCIQQLPRISSKNHLLSKFPLKNFQLLRQLLCA